ncbi:MAG: CoA transferase [Rhizobium sp.]|nr:CoA transferase [Rhizobium sp.]
MGFGAQALRSRFSPPHYMLRISGYGDEGPLRDLKAYDLLVQAESGLSAITGNEHGSARVGVLGLRHRSRHDRDAGRDAGAVCSLGDRRRPAYRGLALSCPVGLDERALSAVRLWRQGSRTQRPQPPDHRALWRLCLRRRQVGAVLDPERTRMGDALRRCIGPARSRNRSALCLQQRARPQPRSARRRDPADLRLHRSRRHGGAAAGR